jgi:hypothetical protein
LALWVILIVVLLLLGASIFSFGFDSNRIDINEFGESGDYEYFPFSLHGSSD